MRYSRPEPARRSDYRLRLTRRIMLRARDAGLNGLVASFGLALIDRAIIDALGRVEGASVFALVKANRLDVNAATATDLAGFDFGKLLGSLAPATSIQARHTVGLVDALTRAETEGKRIDDGLPESLEEVVAAYGHRYFKLKVGGQIDADIERLCGIAALLDRIDAPYQATLDGNEQYHDIDEVIALWRRIGEEPRLARMKSSIIFIEQPIGRDRALAASVKSLSDEIPIEIDESDADVAVFPQARALGYRGISSKSCKGFYRALINRARIEKWNAEEPGRYFMSAEDLTTQAGVARAAGPCAGVAHRRHTHRTQRSPLWWRHDRRAARGGRRVPQRPWRYLSSRPEWPGTRDHSRWCDCDRLARYTGTWCRPASRFFRDDQPTIQTRFRHGRDSAPSVNMKTEGLSINLATVRKQYGFKDGVEAFVKHGVRGISPWREHVQAVGVG